MVTGTGIDRILFEKFKTSHLAPIVKLAHSYLEINISF
jgi:hypothetical protein